MTPLETTLHLIAENPHLAPLRNQPVWCVWRYETNGSGKPTKVPYRAADPSRKASTTKPAEWRSFDEAAAAAKEFDGVGFLLSGNLIAAFDLDNCRNPETGALALWVRGLFLDQCHSYVEITPSGAGLRIIGYCGRHNGAVHCKVPMPDGGSLEIYRKTSRYIAVTGNALPGYDIDLFNIDHAIDMHRRVDTPKPPKPARSPKPVPADLLSLVAHEAPVGERSEEFFAAAAVAKEAGVGQNQLEAAMREHPNGVAAKYLEGRDRLRREIDRVYEKVEGHAVTAEDFVAYREMHNFIFRPTRAFWPAPAVDAELPPVTVAGGKTMAASKWIDKHQGVQQITWSPGDPELIRGRLTDDGGFIERPGVTVFNLYRPPVILPGDPGRAGPWLDHVRLVYPDNAAHIIQFLAHRLQRPAEKINHALLLGGNQGIGKDTLIEPVKQAVGHWNFAEATPSDMFATFTRFLRSVVLRVNEGRDLGDVDRFKLYDRMKSIIAAPPDVLKINEKNLREYYVPNVCSVIITSNYKTDGIYLPEDDRRHYVAYSEKSKEDFPKAYWEGLWGWYEHGGHSHVAAYLRGLDISGFNAKAPPPKTAAFYDIVAAGCPAEVSELADIIDKLGNPAALTPAMLKTKAAGGIFEWLDDRKNRKALPHRLEKCGYAPVRNKDAKDGLWKIKGARQVVYGRCDLTTRERTAAAQKAR